MSIALLLIGFVLGPGYYVYVRHFSGQLMSTQTLPLAGAQMEAVTLHLTPDMNPIGLVLRFSAAYGATAHPPNSPRNEYRAELLDGERVVLAHRFSLNATSVESTPAATFQQALPLFDADRAAEYRLSVQLQGEGAMQIHSADVQVRAKMRSPDWRLLALGGVLLVLGVAGWMR